MSSDSSPLSQVLTNGESSDQDAIDRAQARLDAAHQSIANLKKEFSSHIFGQDDVLEQLLMGILGGGHSILVGVPGLAKTTIVKQVARMLGLKFHRIQFTPDLMPSDITGTEIIQEDRQSGSRSMRFIPGPIFAQVLLADEINRTPPKTQAALLEAMQERQVTVAGQVHELPSPFFVLATQNPIEQEGTYPLPEAQLDRFMFQIHIRYPAEEDEFEILKQQAPVDALPRDPLLSEAELRQLMELTRQIPVADHVTYFALSLARMTRPDNESAPEFVKRYVSWGSGPRAGQFLILAAKARALLKGQPHVRQEDIRHVVLPVLRHRLVLNFSAEADKVTADDILKDLLTHVDSPAFVNRIRERLSRLFRSRNPGGN